MNKSLRASKFEILGSLTWPVGGLILLLLFNLALNWKFFGVDNLTQVLINSSTVAVVGLGMTLVIATGGVDLSVGVVVAIGGAVAAVVLHETAQPWYMLAAALAAAVAAGAVCGAWNGFLVSVMRIQPIIATLIFMVAGRGLAELMVNSRNMSVTDTNFIAIWRGHLLGFPGPILIALGMLALTGLLTRKTALGLFIESVGDNQVASRYAGINAGLVLFLVYVFAGICAGLGGVMVTANLAQMNPFDVGINMELDAILATVIGGTALTGGKFSLTGTMVGAVLIEALSRTLVMVNIPPEQAPLPKGLAILLVCMLQSAPFRAKISGLVRLGQRRGT